MGNGQGLSLADRSSFPSKPTVEDVLSHDRSLAWPEKWTRGVRAGSAEADAGDLVTWNKINTLQILGTSPRVTSVFVRSAREWPDEA
ncbi:hypothetical protein A8L48_01985 [Rhizobium rhizogenes]|nr:hypothetical protein A8L48_01985 [Rhizobium rhizogenes]